MENNVDIKNIIQHAANLLEEYEFENLSKTTFNKYISGYPIPTKLDHHQEEIQDKLKLIYWAVASTHIELGNMLIALHSYNKFRILRDENNTELSYMLFIHHYYLAIECIYRVWERVSRVLAFIHPQELNVHLHFHCVVPKLKESSTYPVSLINEIESHLQQWKDLRDERNKISHEYTKLTEGINFDVRAVPLVNEKGEPLFLIKETRSHDLKLNKIKEQYNYLKTLDQTLINFINYFN